MASLSSMCYLTSDDLDKIFQSTRKSVDYLSEFDDSSTEASTDSSFWESSEADTDLTATDDLSSEQSGSGPSELSGEDAPGSSDSDLGSNFTKPQPYNLRLRKRAKCSEFFPSVKQSCLDSDASTLRSKGEQRGQGNGGGREGRRGGQGQGQSDQFLAYHNVLRKTVHYWKTLFYHLIDTSVVNAFVIYNIKTTKMGAKTVTENDFRDTLVLQIINKYGRNKRGESGPGRPSRSDCRVKHGSRVFDVSQKARCQYCRLQGKTKWTQRKCADCLFQPALCQTLERDCHALWHVPNFDDERDQWIRQKSAKSP